MSININKTESGWLKSILKENLWFIVLLAPLLVVAFFIGQNVLMSKKQSSHRGIAMVVGSVEISAVELASIVAKPFTELLAMDVYAKRNNKYRSATLASVTNKKSTFDVRRINIHMIVSLVIMSLLSWSLMKLAAKTNNKKRK